MLCFGAWIYYWNGKYYVVARNGGTTKSIVSPYILDVKKIENENRIKYVKVSTDVVWQDKCNDLVGAPWSSAITHSKDYGDDTVVSGKQMLVDGTDFLNKIYTLVVSDPVSQYPDPAINPSGGTDSYLDSDVEPFEGFWEEEIETGMVLIYNDGAAPTTITDVPQDIRIAFPDYNVTVNTGLDYYCVRQPGIGANLKSIFKAELLTQMAAAIYNDFFLTSPDVINVKLRDISEFINLHYRFVLFGNNHRIKSAKFYFDKDELSFDLVQVA